MMQQLVAGKNIGEKFALDLKFKEKYEWKQMSAVRMND